MPTADTPINRRAYVRGWNASANYSGTGRDGKTPLERADDRGEPTAWYLGYEDYAADRAKFSSLVASREDYP